jgi:tetratricopeptide (TPR) repeat protein
MKRNNQAALTQLEKAMSIDPNLVDVLSMITAIHLSNKEPKKALDRVMAQLKQSPDNPLLHQLLGRAYIATNDLNSAEESLKKAINLKNDLVGAYIDLGDIYSKKGVFEDAIKQYNEAIKVNPKLLQPYMLLGVIYEKQNKIDKAIENYKKALEINPKFAPAANNLAWLYAEHGGNIDAALSLAQTAKEINPEDPSVSDTLGWIYYKKQVYLTAISHLKESAEKMPNNPVVRYHLGMAYYKKGDKKLAKEELSASLKLSKEFSGAEDAKKIVAELSK